MTDTMPGRRAAPVAAVVLVAVASTLASWAAFVPHGGTNAAPVVVATDATTTTTSLAPTTTTSVAVTADASTTTVPASTSTSTPAAAVPVANDDVVLATTDDVVEAWSPAGKLGAARPCEARPNCRVVVSTWADGTVVSAVVDGDGVTPRSSLVRSPLDGGAGTTVAQLAFGAWIQQVAVAGGDVWWTEFGDGAPTARLRRTSLAGDGPVVDVARDVLGVAPDRTGHRLALQRRGDPATGVSSLAVVDLDTGMARTHAAPAGTAWLASIVWLDDERLLVQGADAVTVIDASPGRDLRVVRTLPLIAACVDAPGRVVGVQRTTNADRSMRHTLADADPATGRVTPWAGADLADGVIACRGDGAVLALSFATGVADTELVAVRASGRRTVLGRGYGSLAARRGSGGFSSMNCGPAGEGGSGPV